MIWKDLEVSLHGWLMEPWKGKNSSGLRMIWRSPGICRYPRKKMIYAKFGIQVRVKVKYMTCHRRYSNKYVWTWWIPCKLADRRKPIWVALPCWDVSRYCSSSSSMSFNRWPMFCVRGNPFPPWGGCLDTVLPVRILPRGPPDEIYWLQTVVTIGETSQRSTLWRWTLTQETWRMSVRLHEFASAWRTSLVWARWDWWYSFKPYSLNLEHWVKEESFDWTTKWSRRRLYLSSWSRDPFRSDWCASWTIWLRWWFAIPCIGRCTCSLHSKAGYYRKREGAGMTFWPILGLHSCSFLGP